jgi:ATP-dependent 26S proteasome regulatory subunit
MTALITQNHNWMEENHRYLMKALAYMGELLDHKLSGETTVLPTLDPSHLSPPSVLEQLCHIFNLSSFERDIILLCAGMEINCHWRDLLAKIQGNAQLVYPTLSLALKILPNPHWQGLTPAGALRRWKLMEIGSGVNLTQSPLRIDERILHYLWGIQYVDERLSSMLLPLVTVDHLVPSYEVIVQEVAQAWLNAQNRHFPVIQLCGEDSVSKQAIAQKAALSAGLHLHCLSSEHLPTDFNQLYLLTCLWERECVLSNSGILLNCDWSDHNDPQKEQIIAFMIESLQCPLMISIRERRPLRQRPLVTFDIHNPSSHEQRLIWSYYLGTKSAHLNGNIDQLVSQFNLSLPAIESACVKINSLECDRKNFTTEKPEELDHIYHQLWDLCRKQARPRLDELAQQIEASADWDDLILPPKEKEILKEIVIHVQYKSQVYEKWGFADKSKRGLGISALFAGQSGTGKTMAAEVLAHTLKLDVYRIDLSSVVSKYIGETEKNLRKVFDAAEGGGTILLFDEADSLFGKRSDVKDSHDRYANMEVSYLLQRMEAYQGLAILTTNLKDSIDQAFLRRIRFVVQFPFPDHYQRAEIWRKVFPQKTPTQGLDYEKLSSLHVAGGNIRNIAMNAAFLATASDEPVMMKHILQAAKSEYIKLERPMPTNETRGWVEDN